MIEDTICDRCSTEIPMDESNGVDSGEWQGCTLCNECYGQLVMDGEIKD
jgi:hypothetical protein